MLEPEPVLDGEAAMEHEPGVMPLALHVSCEVVL